MNTAIYKPCLIVLLCTIISLPQKSFAWQPDLNLSLGYLETCANKSSCLEGFSLGLDFRFYQTGPRSENQETIAESALNTGGNVFNHSGSNIFRGIQSPGELVLAIFVAIAAFFIVWFVALVFHLVFSGRVAVGLYSDLAFENATQGNIRSGQLGLSITTYPLDNFDIALTFAMGRRLSKWVGSNDSREFSGLNTKIGIGYIPNIASSGPLIKFERQNSWNQFEDVISVGGNREQRLILPRKSSSDTFSIGWSFAL